VQETNDEVPSRATYGERPKNCTNVCRQFHPRRVDDNDGRRIISFQNNNNNNAKQAKFLINNQKIERYLYARMVNENAAIYI